MKKFVNNFSKWSKLFESELLENTDQMLADIKRLVELGIIDISELKAAIRKKDIPSIIAYTPGIKEILDSPEYKELQQHGLELVSSKTQLLNGSILFGYPGYIPSNQFAIGLYPGPKVIRRNCPKGINMGIRTRKDGIGSMDAVIKTFNFVEPHQFYQVCMRWILDHIDFKSINTRSKTPYFPVKSRTRKGYFNQD